MSRVSQNTPLMETNMKLGEASYNNYCQNIGELILNTFRSQPNFIAQVNADTGEQITFQQMKDNSVRCALWLKRWGVERGDVVAIYTGEYTDIHVPYLATLYIGAILFPWGTCRLREKAKIKYYLRRSNPKVIFAEYNIRLIDRQARNLNMTPRIITFYTTRGYVSLESMTNSDLFHDQGLENFSCTKLRSVKDTVAILVRGHMTRFSRDTKIPHVIFIAPSNREIPVMRPGDVGLWTEPSYSFIGLLLTVRCILSYVKVIKTSYVNIYNFSSIVHSQKVNWAFLGIDREMLKNLEMDLNRRYDTRSLKHIICDGRSISSYFRRNITEALPSACIIQVYYHPEIGIISYQRNLLKITSSGRACKDVSICITDLDTGELLGPQKVGKICCRSPSVKYEYHEDHETTNIVIDKNGWFHTEDAGYIDEDGDIYVIDKIMNLIKYRQYYVSSTEIADLLRSHSAILYAAVVPRPHDVDGEHPTAFVKLISQVTKEELHLLVAENLNDYSKLRGGIFFLETSIHLTHSLCNRLAQHLSRHNTLENFDFD